MSGFVHVNPRTLETDYDSVYAIGDVATIKLPNGKALPKAGVFAHAEAKVVARADRGRRAGEASDAVFDGNGYCWIELGDGRAGFAGGNFYAEPEPQVKIRRPAARSTGARWPSRSGGSTTGSRECMASGAGMPRGTRPQ